MKPKCHSERWGRPGAAADRRRAARRGARSPRHVSRSRHALALLACALLLAFAAGCGGGGGATPGSVYGVQGNVLDMASGTGVSGAVVTVGTAATKTDAQGGFELVGLTPGTQTISAEAPGYADCTESVSVAAGITTIPDLLLLESPPLPPQ